MSHYIIEIQYEYLPLRFCRYIDEFLSSNNFLKVYFSYSKLTVQCNDDNEVACVLNFLLQDNNVDKNLFASNDCTYHFFRPIKGITLYCNVKSYKSDETKYSSLITYKSKEEYTSCAVKTKPIIISKVVIDSQDLKYDANSNIKIKYYDDPYVFIYKVNLEWIGKKIADVWAKEVMNSFMIEVNGEFYLVYVSEMIEGNDKILALLEKIADTKLCEMSSLIDIDRLDVNKMFNRLSSHVLYGNVSLLYKYSLICSFSNAINNSHNINEALVIEGSLKYFLLENVSSIFMLCNSAFLKGKIAERIFNKEIEEKYGSLSIDIFKSIKEMTNSDMTDCKIINEAILIDRIADVAVASVNIEYNSASDPFMIRKKCLTIWKYIVLNNNDITSYFSHAAHYVESSNELLYSFWLRCVHETICKYLEITNRYEIDAMKALFLNTQCLSMDRFVALYNNRKLFLKFKKYIKRLAFFLRSKVSLDCVKDDLEISLFSFSDDEVFKKLFLLMIELESNFNSTNVESTLTFLNKVFDETFIDGSNAYNRLMLLSRLYLLVQRRFQFNEKDLSA